MVMCTHLHVDHVGWNTKLVDGEWVPTFPNARYLIAKEEWEQTDQDSQVLADSVRPIIDAGLAEFVATDYQLSTQIRLRSTPGHTPGHVSVEINSEGKTALITGDCIHHPCQMEQNDWCSTADSDPEQAMATRSELLASLVDQETLVIGTHFATPTAGWVKQRDDGAYWLSPMV